MLEIVRSEDRHTVDAGWLKARWHFSFDHYYDPKHVQFGPLRVFNNDVVQPAKGFPMHPHANMEILTYVIDGAAGDFVCRNDQLRETSHRCPFVLGEFLSLVTPQRALHIRRLPMHFLRRGPINRHAEAGGGHRQSDATQRIASRDFR